MLVKKKKRTIIEKEGKFYTVRGVELTRASHTMTESEFWAKILSALRNATRFWKPAQDKLNEGRRNSMSSNKRLKYEYNCESCRKWFPQKEIQLDHIIPCGGINGIDKVAGWIEKAFVEIEGYQRLCVSCHNKKTLAERKIK